eukprot:scaffold12861_cov134-Isochrysis_galbana.AAC.3
MRKTHGPAFFGKSPFGSTGPKLPARRTHLQTEVAGAALAPLEGVRGARLRAAVDVEGPDQLFARGAAALVRRRDRQLDVVPLVRVPVQRVAGVGLMQIIRDAGGDLRQGVPRRHWRGDALCR